MLQCLSLFNKIIISTGRNKPLVGMKDYSSETRDRAMNCHTDDETLMKWLLALFIAESGAVVHLAGFESMNLVPACGRVNKTQCCEPFEVFCPWFEPHRRNHFTTSQQSTQLSILPGSVNEYSEVTQRTSTGHTLITANLKVEMFHPV